MSPNEWIAFLRDHPHWGVRRLRLSEEVKAYLDGPKFHVEAGSSIPTTQLLEGLWPEHEAHGEAITLRASLFDELNWLAKHTLAGTYASAGAPKKVMGRMVIPNRWHPRVKARIEAGPGLDVERAKAEAYKAGYDAGYTAGLEASQDA